MSSVDKTTQALAVSDSLANSQFGIVYSQSISKEIGFDSSLEFAAKSRNCTVSGFFIGTPSYGGAGGRAQALPVFAPRVPRSVNPSALPPDLTVGRQSFNGTLEATHG